MEEIINEKGSFSKFFKIRRIIFQKTLELTICVKKLMQKRQGLVTVRLFTLGLSNVRILMKNLAAGQVMIFLVKFGRGAKNMNV